MRQGGFLLSNTYVKTRVRWILEAVLDSGGVADGHRVAEHLSEHGRTWRPYSRREIDVPRSITDFVKTHMVHLLEAERDKGKKRVYVLRDGVSFINRDGG